MVLKPFGCRRRFDRSMRSISSAKLRLSPGRVLMPIVLAALLSAGGLSAGDVYRWRDANGALHFSDIPPSYPDGAVHTVPGLSSDENSTPDLPATNTDAPVEGVFWQIDTAARSPSYLLGTIHSADPRVTAFQPKVLRAFDRAEVFVMEMALEAQSFLALGASMMFTDDRDLERLLGREDFHKVVAATAAHPIPEAVLRKMKPWAVMALISQPAPPSSPFMDMLLYQKATAMGKPVVGLESAAEQIAVFSQMSMADQLALLRASLDQARQMPAMRERMIETYLTGDLAAIANLSQTLAGPDPSGLNQRFIYQLNDARNDRLVTRMLPHLNAGGAFIAVGALHLTGERGLIRQLRARGYRLSPLP